MINQRVCDNLRGYMAAHVRLPPCFSGFMYLTWLLYSQNPPPGYSAVSKRAATQAVRVREALEMLAVQYSCQAQSGVPMAWQTLRNRTKTRVVKAVLVIFRVTVVLAPSPCQPLHIALPLYNTHTKALRITG